MYGSKGKLRSNCCFQSQDSQCARKFNPPLLSTATEFCDEVLAKGLPVPACVLAENKKLVIEKESPPIAKLATSRHIKNWQRWCFIWRQTYNALTAKRNLEGRPPVMSSGEEFQFKKEDKEIFDRTIHAYRNCGYSIKNVEAPDSIRPKPFGDDAEIRELVTRRYLRDYPEMKRHRYPNHVRNEISIPPRKTPPKKEARLSTMDEVRVVPTSKGFNFEEKWRKNRQVEETKEMLACDLELYGKSDPFGNNLIVQSEPIKHEVVSISKTKLRQSVLNRPKVAGKEFSVPQFVFTLEEDDDADSGLGLANAEQRPAGQYIEFHGPILKIRSQFSDTSLRYSKRNAETHLISESTEPPTLEGQYLFDGNQHFSVTSKCKDMKCIELKNEGTTAIRYQWFRNPPNQDEVKMLRDPTHHKMLRLTPNGDKLQQGNGSMMTSLNLQKKPTLEFHFSELPRIILPGQSMEFPIIFRSKTPGYFHETIYLLTHPKLTNDDGKHYGVRLSGVCTHIEMPERGNELFEADVLRRYLDDRSLEAESEELLDSILERSLWEAVHWQAGGDVNAKRQILTDAKVKLFEDLMCDQIENILSSVDNYKMMDNKFFDIFNIIDNSC